jgi:hypothetical protein
MMNEITEATKKKKTAGVPSHHYRNIAQSTLGCGTE